MPKLPITPDEIPDLLNDAIEQWGWQARRIASFLKVSEKSVSRWRKGVGVEKIREATLARFAELKRLYLRGGEVPPSLVEASPTAGIAIRQAFQDAGLASSQAKDRFGTAAAAVVRAFYDAIGRGDTRSAWARLSQGFRERRWKGHFERFDAGFKLCRRLENVVIVPLAPVEEGSCRLLVYYEDHTDTVILPGLSGWRAGTLGMLSECSGELERVRAALRKVAVTALDVENTPLQRLFTDHAGAILHHASGLTLEHFSSAVGPAFGGNVLIAMPFIAVVHKTPAGECRIESLMPVHWGCRVPGR